MLIQETIILNTLADNAADFVVTSNIRITGMVTNPIPASGVRVSITPSVAEVRGVRTYTFGAPPSVGTQYQASVQGNTAVGGGSNPTNPSWSYTSVSGDTAATVATNFRTWVNANQTNLQVVGTGSSADVIVTANAGFPIINGTTKSVSSLVSIAVTTAGVAGVGLGTYLPSDPNYLGTISYGSFTAGASYTRVLLSWNSPNQAEAAASSTSSAANTLALFINEAATATAGSLNTAAANRASLLNSSYGVVYLLQAGYRAVVSTATPTISIASNVATLAGTSPSVITAGIMPNDWLVADPIGTPSAAQVLALGAGSTAGTWDATKFYTSGGSASAKTFTLIQVRNIPRSI